MTLTPRVGGGFSLVDHHGRAVTDRDYLGAYMLIFFGFTRCRVVCPRALARLSTAIEALGSAADRIRPLYISIDPERDTPATLRDFLLAWPRFTGLTGSVDQIESARRAFRVFVGQRSGADGEEIAHSAFTHLVGAEGNHLDHWSDTLDAAEVTTLLRRWLSTSA